MLTLPNISPELIKTYQDEISKSSSPATARRKSISLNKFFNWAESSGKIDQNPLRMETPKTPEPTKPRKKHIGTKTWATLGVTAALVILIFLFLGKIRLPISFKINLAQESDIQTVTGQKGSDGTSPPGTNPANGAVIAGWKLYAKLKLTDAEGQPQTGSQTVSFKIFDQDTGGALLYTSDSKTVTADSNGTALISLDTVPTDLFFQNNRLYLEPQVNSKTISSRIPISTANVAANLGGFFPADPDGGAEAYSIPVIDGTGALVIASQTPSIKGTDGTLLIESQAVTIKTADGGSGDIEINPDAGGIAHFLFEGSKGKFLNAQAPNLSSGSLYYGMVPNNATGYYLANLQSGSPTLITRFSVDALGNTYASGNLNVAGNIATSGTTRLTSGGALTSITGYSQDSGDFTITQGSGDAATITRTGTAINDVLELTLNETGQNSSSYSTLTLNRTGGNISSSALYVDSGSAIFDEQIMLGRFSSNPDPIGEGSIIYNSTNDNIYYWNGSSWIQLATGSGFSGSFADLTSGTNTIATMVVGSGASLDYTGTGTINASSLIGATWTAPGAIGSVTPNSGAFTTLSSTGVTTLGNGSATVAIDSSDWDINTAGDMTGIGAIAANGTIAFTGTTIGLGTSNSATTVNIATGTGTDTVNIGTDATGADTISIGNSNVGTTLSLTGGDDWSLTGTGVLTLSASAPQTTAIVITDTDYTNALNIGDNNIIGTTAAIDLTNFDVEADGDIVTAGDLAVNGGDITTTATTFNLLAGATTLLNIGPAGDVGSITLAGGSGATGCTLDGTNGDFTCSGTISGTIGGSVSFASITSGTNTGAAMVVGSGASLDYTGTGTINASSLIGATWTAPGAIGSVTPNSGAFTTLSSTGVTTLGNGSATVAIDSSDWDINTAGDMTGIGAIAANGTIAFTGTTIGLGTSNSATTVNIGTGTGGNTFNIGTDNTLKDTINIGSALDDLAVTSDSWSISNAGVASISGTLTVGNGITNVINSPYGPLTLQYKSGADTWTDSIVIRDSTGDLDFAGGYAGGSGCTIVNSTGALSCTTITGTISGTIPWSEIDNPTGNLTLTMDDGEITTFDIQSDTETGFAWNTSTLTTGNLLSLASTSTAMTSANLLNILATGDPTASWTGSLGIIEYTTSTDADIDGSALKVGITGAGAGDGTALNVTTAQTGTSAFALRVNDDGTYTDSTPFVVNTAGNVGVATSAPIARIEAVGSSSVASVSGSNVLTADGGFDSSTGWTVGSGWTIGSSVVTHSTGLTGNLSGTSTATSTTTLYQVSFVVTVTTGGTGFTVSLGSMDSGSTFTTAGTKTVYIRPTATSGTLRFTPGAGGTFVGTIDTVTIKPITESVPELTLVNSDGTTTNMDFRAGGNGDRNLFIGTNSGKYNISGTDLTAVGYNALSTNYSGFGNSAFGGYALYLNNSGYENSAFGNYSLRSNISGVGNSGFGVASLYNNSSGSFNTSIGYYSLNGNSTSDNNTALGSFVMSSVNPGASNTGVGAYALDANYTGTETLALGAGAGGGLTSGSYNTLVGTYAGDALTTGASNIVIGYAIDLPANNSSNMLDIGNLIYATGLTSTGTTISTGSVGIGTTSPAAKLDVAGSATISGTLSLARMLQSDAGTCDYSTEGKQYYDGPNSKYYYCNGTVWTAMGSGGGGAWNDLTSPDGTLTLDMLTHPTTFNWDTGTSTSDLFSLTTDASSDGTGYLFNLATGTSSTVKPFHVSAGAVEALMVDASGSVGIGTTSPTAKLDIEGSASSSGTLTFRGTTDPSINILNDENLTFKTSVGGDAGLTTTMQMTNTGNFSALGSLQIGAATNSVAYSRFGTATTSHAGTITAANDLLITGDLELNGNLYLDNNTISNSAGTALITLSSDITTIESQLAGSWLVDNQLNVGMAALMVNQASTVNDIFVASQGGTTNFVIANNGDVAVGPGGTGKITVGTVDPPYTINGSKYATYLTSMAGVKEEVAGNIQTNEYVPGVGYRNVIDFNNLPTGSDLWLFSKATDIKTNISQLVALLTPSEPTKVWYEVDRQNHKLAIYSAKPAEISYRLTGPRFDYADHPNQRTDSAEGFVLNIPDIINTNPVTTTIRYLSGFVIEKIADGIYTVKDSDGVIIDGIESIGNFVAANIKSGAIQTQELATNSFTAFQGTVDNLLISSGLVAGNIQTKLISPVADSTDVTVRIGSEATPSGKLAIQDSTGTEVASIDSEGNASFSGTLFADEIKSKSLDDINALLSQVKTDQDLMKEATDWNTLTSTDSANLSSLVTADLYVTNQGAFNALSVSDSLTVGSDLVFLSALNDDQVTINSIDTLSSPLRIQSLAMAPVEIMAGLVTIDTQGNVRIAGNLNVAGRIESTGLTLKDNEQPGVSNQQSLLSLQDSTGNTVSAVDASGSAMFNSLSTQGLTIAAGPDGTSPGQIVDGVITTNATAGQAMVPAGVTEITISNSKVTDYTLVYVTPTSTTENSVLYVKSKQNGQFTVGFNYPINTDVNFNWWIIQVSQ